VRRLKGKATYTIREEPQSVPRQASWKHRDELAIFLADLYASMPQPIIDKPDRADFMPLFADRADTIARQAACSRRQWLVDRFNALLEEINKYADA
jgi:hypothetical protein